VATTSTHPGLFFIEMRRWSATTLTFNTSVLTKFTGLNGYSIPSNVTATSQTNVLWFSKPFRGDAVPPTNGLRAGPADNQVLRMFPFGERLLLFTTYGIYQVTGRTFADFAVYPFDLGYRLIGRELVALCDEKVYAWCNEGIVEIDSGGVRVVSAPIEPTIETALVNAGGGSSLPNGRTALAALGYATGYRNQHQVRFHYPEANDSANMNGCAYWLSFDTRTRAWARGAFSTEKIAGYADNRACAVVRLSDDLLVFGNWSAGVDTRLFLERRAYAATDFIDTTISGTDDGVTSFAVLQYQVPDARGAMHWQQTVINWDAGEIAWRTLPTTLAITHVNEDGSSGQNVAISSLVTRVETPIDQRRGQRLRLIFLHSAAEYAGIVGIEQDYRGGSRFARQVTP
jgi:hypothetical protein